MIRIDARIDNADRDAISRQVEVVGSKRINRGQSGLIGIPGRKGGDLC